MKTFLKYCCVFTLLLALASEAKAGTTKAGYIEGLEPFAYGGGDEPKMYHYGSKDFKKIHTVNTEILVQQYLEAYKTILDPRRDLTVAELTFKTRVETVLREDTEMTLKKIFEAEATKKINPTDKRNLYVITFVSMRASDTIDYLNELHKRYGLFSNVKIMMINHGRGANKEKQMATYKLGHEKKSGHMGSRAPIFPVGLDTNIPMTSAYQAFTEAADLTKVRGPIFVVDKNASLIWMGSAKSLRYNWSRIHKGLYKREHFLTLQKDRAEFRTYARYVSNPTKQEVVKDLSKRLLTSLRYSPDGCLELAEIIKKRDIFSNYDSELYFKLVRNAANVTNEEEPEILLELAHAYFEKGELDFAIAKLDKLLKLKILKEVIESTKALKKEWQAIKPKIGTANFRSIQKAKDKISKELWPALQNPKYDQKALIKLLQDAYKSIRVAPRLSSRFAFKCLMSKRMMGENEGLDMFLKKLITSAVNSVDKDPSKWKKEDHVIFAAMAYYYDYTGKKKEAVTWIKKAINLKPESKNLRFYSAFLRAVNK